MATVLKALTLIKLFPSSVLWNFNLCINYVYKMQLLLVFLLTDLQINKEKTDYDKNE